MQFTEDQYHYLVNTRGRIIDKEISDQTAFPSSLSVQQLSKLLSSVSPEYLMKTLLQDLFKPSNIEYLSVWQGFFVEKADLFFLHRGMELLLVRLMEAKETLGVFNDLIQLLSHILHAGRILLSSV